MDHHHEVVLVGTSVGLPQYLAYKNTVRQLQLSGARQAEVFLWSENENATHVGTTTWLQDQRKIRNLSEVWSEKDHSYNETGKKKGGPVGARF